MITTYDYNLFINLEKSDGAEFIKNNNLFQNLNNFIHRLEPHIKYSLGESNRFVVKNDINNIKKAMDLSYSYPLYLNQNLYVYRCYQKGFTYSLICKQKKIGRFLSTTLDLKLSSELCYNSFSEPARNIKELPELGQKVYFKYKSNNYVGIVININNSLIKFHLTKCIETKLNFINNHKLLTSSIIIPIKSITILFINPSLNICIKLEKKSSGILPILFYENQGSENYNPINSLSAYCDKYSKSESPKDYYKELLLDFKGNLVPLFSQIKDPLFRSPDILTHNDCSVFKYQDRYHNTNFNRISLKKIRMLSLKKNRLNYSFLDTKKNNS